MVRHLIEAVVKYGEFGAFYEAVQRHNKVCSDHGLAAYELWANNGAGRMNEVFFEATFDDLQQMHANEKAMNEHADVMATLGQVLSFCVPGSITDRHLSRP